MFQILVLFLFLILIVISEIKELVIKRKQEIKDRNLKAAIRRIKLADEVKREFNEKYNIKIDWKNILKREVMTMNNIEERVKELEKEMRFQKLLSTISGTTIFLMLVCIELLKRKN